jgi:putative MFS transporter
MKAVNAGARLDRLTVSGFHGRMLGMIGAGTFLDAFDIYLQGAVLGTLVSLHWSTPQLNATFISVTFAGMVLGAWLAGILGDRFGRRFSYQTNLLIFGLASLAGALAPSISWLIAARFVMGIGLGAEIVVGYVLLMEFMPPASRGRWGTGLAVITNSALFVSALVGRFVIPNFGWRWMFVIVGVGAMIVWQLRKSMPESPRWLESKGRLEEAEQITAAIERTVAAGRTLPPPRPGAVPVLARPSLATLFAPGLVSRTLIGAFVLVTLNTAIYGFIAFLPTFMVQQGIGIVKSLTYTTLMSFGAPVGAILGMLLGERLGRRGTIVWFSLAAVVFGALYPLTADPRLLMLIGFLMVGSIYVLVAIAWGVYVPELFPTEVRMRGNGFCNTAGRLMTIVTPQLVVLLFATFGIAGVIAAVALLLVIQAGLVAHLGIETRGQPLEALVPQAVVSLAVAPGSLPPGAKVLGKEEA